MDVYEWSEHWSEKLQPLAGAKLLGVVDGGGAVEFVFEDKGERNLVTVYPDGRLEFGGVTDPSGYLGLRHSELWSALP